MKNEKRCRLLKATTGFFYHRRNTRALSFPLFFVPRARALFLSLARALLSLSLSPSLPRHAPEEPPAAAREARRVPSSGSPGARDGRRSFVLLFHAAQDRPGALRAAERREDGGALGLSREGDGRRRHGVKGQEGGGAEERLALSSLSYF